MTERTTLRVDTSHAAPYDVVVGSGLLEDLVGTLGAAVRRVAVIHPVGLAATGERVRRHLLAAGLETHALEVPDGEAAKVVDVAAFCWGVLGESGFTRSDAVVTVGGGSTTDLGGFVAATWLRGVRVVHLPTSLLAMVDAAVGGKTGLNTEHGKNLVGSFHEPAGVLCDLDFLTTLPRNELVSGLAEVVKCGFIADPTILDLVEEDATESLAPGSARFRDLVERAIAVKIDVVTGDLTETGGPDGGVGREVLNYGHTLGHAVERTEGYRFRHGAAVAIGMMYVASLARLDGRLDATTATRHRDVLSLVGLPTSYPAGRWEELVATMRLDKKTRGDQLRFVVLDGLARPAILQGPDEALLSAAYHEISG